jgi:chorismate mutase
MKVYEPRREEQVLANVNAHNRGPLSDEALKRIYERVMDEMRTLQRDMMRAGEDKPK